MSKKILFETLTKYLLYFNVIFILGYTFFVLMDSVWSGPATDLLIYKLSKYFILSFVIAVAMVIYYVITKNASKINIANITILVLLCIAEFVIYNSRLHPIHPIAYTYYIISFVICMGKVFN